MISLLFKKYNLADIDKQLGDSLWSPIDVAHINDFVIRAAAVQGEYHWHHHEDDEGFLVYKGSITIDTPEESIQLAEGEGVVIPKGTRHRPRAQERSIILMIEPHGVRTQGS